MWPLYLGLAAVGVYLFVKSRGDKTESQGEVDPPDSTPHDEEDYATPYNTDDVPQDQGGGLTSVISARRPTTRNAVTT